MANEQDILATITRVSIVQLSFWITEEWVKPVSVNAAFSFNDADVARIRLLDLLLNDLDVGAEAIPIILSLIDQVHDLRAQLRIVSEAIGKQPDDVRLRLLEIFEKDQ